MTEQQLARIWEVLANVGSTPSEAVDALARNEGIVVTRAEAATALIAAKRRNTLKLVIDRSDLPQRSNFGHRLSGRG